MIHSLKILNLFSRDTETKHLVDEISHRNISEIIKVFQKHQSVFERGHAFSSAFLVLQYCKSHSEQYFLPLT